MEDKSALLPRRYLKPLDQARSDLQSITDAFTDILKTNPSNCTLSAITELKKVKRNFTSESEYLIKRLRENGNVDESEGIREHKLTLLTECYRMLNEVNRLRDKDNEDLVSNSTPDCIANLSHHTRSEFNGQSQVQKVHSNFSDNLSDKLMRAEISTPKRSVYGNSSDDGICDGTVINMNPESEIPRSTQSILKRPEYETRSDDSIHNQPKSYPISNLPSLMEDASMPSPILVIPSTLYSKPSFPLVVDPHVSNFEPISSNLQYPSTTEMPQRKKISFNDESHYFDDINQFTPKSSKERPTSDIFPQRDHIERHTPDFQSQNVNPTIYPRNTQVQDTMVGSNNAIPQYYSHSEPHYTPNINIEKPYSNTFPSRDHIRSHPSDFQSQNVNPRIYSRNNQMQDTMVGSNNAIPQYYSHSDAASSYILREQLLSKPSKPFSGIDESFHTWSTILKSRMRCVQLTPFDQIHVLINNTTGTPRAIIEDYMFAAGNYISSNTVDTIWNVLGKRFGSSYLGVQYIERRVNEFPVLRHLEQKQELGRLIDLCRVISSQMINVEELRRYNYSEGMKQLWSKLPQVLQSRWRTYAVNVKTNSGGINPNISVFIGFLERIHAEISDEFFNSFSVNYGKGPSKVLATDSKDSSLITNISSPTIPTNKSSFPNSSSHNTTCPLHTNSKHFLKDCVKFSKMSYEERKELVKQHKLCFRCLGPHMAKYCKISSRCEKCARPHITLMHDDNYGKYQRISEVEEVPATENTKNLCIQTCNNGIEKICSKTLLLAIRYRDKGKIIKGYGIIDEQSSSSFIDPSLIEMLNVPSETHSYSLRTLTGYESTVQGRKVEGLQVSGIKERKWYKLPTVLTNEFIPDSREEVATPGIIGQFRHLSHLKHNFLNIRMDLPVLMLLGADAGEILHTKCHGQHAPYIHQTPVGWALVGSAFVDYVAQSNTVKVLKVCVPNPEYSYSSSSIFPSTKQGQLDVFKEFNEDEEMDHSIEEKKFINIMENSVKVENSHIVLPLPFKENKPIMPDNKSAVYHRTKVALSRLCKDQAKLQQCLKSIDTNIKKGHIEPVPEDELDTSEGKRWYLPIFAVTHPKKNKARLVFDASASFQGICLNQKLLTGPHLTNSLKSVLLKFRKGLIGITCDISHMFYNFYLPKDDRDYMRFFFYENNDPQSRLIPYRAKVHLFGASSSPAAASFGLRYAAQNTQLKDVDAAKDFILDSFYVDDGVTSVDSVDQGVKILLNTKKLLREFDINVHQFSSSSPEVLNALPKEDVAENLRQISFDESPSHRTLGVVWNLALDSFVVNAEIPETSFTKRGILAAVNSFFDPLGIASPVILGGRLIQRMVLPTKDKLDAQLEACQWDDPLPDKYLPVWREWRSNLSDASCLKLPRCFVPQEFGTVVKRDLHIFSDASIDAIGAVIYMRSINERNEVHVSFVTSTSRVAPRCATSIPRLELNAALQAVILVQEVLKALTVTLNETFFYTDSLVVLGYINNSTKNFTKYITRRVLSILRLAPSYKWSYVATQENPADIASRPHSPKELANSCWLTGPNFLLNMDHSPTTDIKTENIQLPEQVVEKTSLFTSAGSTEPFIFNRTSQRTSSFTFLLNVTSIVLRYVRILRSKVVCKPQVDVTKEDAIHCLLLTVQKECYPDVLSLFNNGSLLQESHKLADLNPFLDDKGLIRVGGRIKNADIPFNHAHPILVPTDHKVSMLIIQHLHAEVGHQGRHITHGYIRQRGYHFEKGKSLIKKFIKQCIICRRLRGNLSKQQMANLPSDRLETCPPFSNSGLDVFGPFYVHDGANTRRTSSSKKLFALLITCLVTRAIHIEPLNSMDTSSLVNALRRFFSIRDSCKRLRSDQGSNFIGTINKAGSAIDLKTLQQTAEKHQCEWLMNSPLSSHKGGVWETKIGAVRRILDHTFKQTGKHILSRDDAVTLLQEAASIVNCTPLYEVSSDPNDPCPLTPNCLLTLKDHPHPPPIEQFSERDILQYGARRWRRIQYLADYFWQRWRTEYLQNLTVRRKWKRPHLNIMAGDVVLLRDKALPRNSWPTALVTEVFHGEDNLVRTVTVKINGKLFTRPIHNVVVLIGASEYQ